MLLDSVTERLLELFSDCVVETLLEVDSVFDWLAALDVPEEVTVDAVFPIDVPLPLETETF